MKKKEINNPLWLTSVSSQTEILDYIESLNESNNILMLYDLVLPHNNKIIKEKIFQHKNLSYFDLRKIVLLEKNQKIKNLALKELVNKSPIISNPDLGFILFLNIFSSSFNFKVFFDFFRITIFPFVLSGFFLIFFNFIANIEILTASLISISAGLFLSNIFWFLEKRKNWLPLLDISIIFLIGIPILILSIPLILPAFFFFLFLSQTKSF